MPGYKNIKGPDFHIYLAEVCNLGVLLVLLIFLVSRLSRTMHYSCSLFLFLIALQLAHGDQTYFVILLYHAISVKLQILKRSWQNSNCYVANSSLFAIPQREAVIGVSTSETFSHNN